MVILCLTWVDGLDSNWTVGTDCESKPIFSPKNAHLKKTQEPLCQIHTSLFDLLALILEGGVRSLDSDNTSVWVLVSEQSP